MYQLILRWLLILGVFFSSAALATTGTWTLYYGEGTGTPNITGNFLTLAVGDICGPAVASVSTAPVSVTAEALWANVIYQNSNVQCTATPPASQDENVAGGVTLSYTLTITQQYLPTGQTYISVLRQSFQIALSHWKYCQPQTAFTFVPEANPNYTLATCVGGLPDPTLSMTKVLQNARVANTDQFTMVISATSTPASATTEGKGSTVVPGTGANSQTLTAGVSYTISEQAAGTTDLSKYNSSISCGNSASNTGTSLPQGGGQSFTFTPAQGDMITCTFTNTAKAVNNAVPNPNLGDPGDEDGSDPCTCDSVTGVGDQGTGSGGATRAPAHFTPGGDGGGAPGDRVQGALADPVNVATGNKFLAADDGVAGPDAGSPMRLIRYYNSAATGASGSFGNQWTSFYDRYIQLSADGTTAALFRPDGKGFVFTNNNGAWQSTPNISGVLTQGSTGWTYVTPQNVIERYSTSGQLLTIINLNGLTQTLTYDNTGTLSQVTDNWGRILQFTNDGNSHITSMIDMSGGLWSYGYDPQGDLVTVTEPDGEVLTYVYANQPGQLTSVIDEMGNTTGVTSYDSQGRATSTLEAGNLGTVSISYPAPNTAIVADAGGNTATYGFTIVNGLYKLTSKTLGGASASATFDANGNVSSRTDYNGNTTTFTYDLSRNLETSRIEAAGTALAKTTTTTWEPNFRLPATIAEPGRLTTFVYDGYGNCLSKTVTDTSSGASQTWSWTYNGVGQVVTATGPRADLTATTTYAYDSLGNLHSITNALNQTTLIGNSAAGYPLVLYDPNGRSLTLTYDPLNRISTQTVGFGSGTLGSTWYQYDFAGDLTRVTRPDGNAVFYNYDNEHRLTTIYDALGDMIVYTLDARGNRIKETITDQNGLTSAIKQIQNDLARINFVVKR